MSENTIKLIADNNAKWVDLRFTDPRGKEQHTTVPAGRLDADMFAEGIMFDGSSVSGWKSINESDMMLMPDDSTPVVDPFRDETTVNLRCDIIEPSTMQPYGRDPRSTAKLAEKYLASTGIGDTAYFGPEAEFFVFDDVRWKVEMSGASYAISAEEAAWESDTEFDDGNLGHRPKVKGGYFPVPPVDSAMDLRNAMCSTMQEMGLDVEVHHHEVGTACQGEIGVRFNTLVKKADELQIYKYCVHNVAHAYGKTATFMPKPLVGDNGNGMHVHQSISANGENVFFGTATRGFPTRRCTTSAASSSTPGRSTRSPTRRRTPTSAWCPASRRRCCWRTRPATARPPSAFRTCRGATPSRIERRCASRTRPATRT